jgi:hypothetical protein
MKEYATSRGVSEKRAEREANLSSAVVLLAAVLLPVGLGLAHPPAIQALAVGAAAWALALLLKMLVNGTDLIARATRRGMPGAALAGIVSGISEMGVLYLAAIAGVVTSSAATGLWTGIGASVAEIAYLISVGMLKRAEPETLKQQRIWLRGARSSRLVRHIFAVERLLATVLHIACRVLVLATVASGSLVPLAMALGFFVIVDGTATYGVVRRWNWCRRRTARRFYALLAAAAGAAAFGAYWLAAPI